MNRKVKRETLDSEVEPVAKKRCGYQRGPRFSCAEEVTASVPMCKYHTQGNMQVDPDLYLSLRTHTYRDAKITAPEEGDLRYHKVDLYRFDGKQWRKTCRVCFSQGKPDFCRKHDPQHVTINTRTGFSKAGCEFLDAVGAELGHTVIHRHVRHDGTMENEEYRIPGTSFRVDGYDPDSRTVYEFLGDYWHGSPKYNPQDTNYSTHRTFGELRQQTFQRFREIADRGYRVMYIWESDYRELVKGNNNPRVLEHLHEYTEGEV
jgi:hypothetical protein